MDEKTTTWRAGDRILYSTGCHDAGAIIQVAIKRSVELFFLYGEQDRCFVVNPQLAAILIKWIDGPFRGVVKTRTGSVWQIEDAMGDTEFIWLLDQGGPHEAMEAREA